MNFATDRWGLSPRPVGTSNTTPVGPSGLQSFIYLIFLSKDTCKKKRVSIGLLLAILGVIVLSSHALADKPAQQIVFGSGHEACNFGIITREWDFAYGSHGSTYAQCDPRGCSESWFC